MQSVSSEASINESTRKTPLESNNDSLSSVRFEKFLDIIRKMPKSRYMFFKEPQMKDLVKSYGFCYAAYEKNKNPKIQRKQNDSV